MIPIELILYPENFYDFSFEEEEESINDKTDN